MTSGPSGSTACMVTGRRLCDDPDGGAHLFEALAQCRQHPGALVGIRADRVETHEDVIRAGVDEVGYGVERPSQVHSTAAVLQDRQFPLNVEAATRRPCGESRDPA